ncbi:hypothetical protein KHA80_04150 [Anaerobacillus sp. HL2]|nr:hypothetical protein KHA80_04150 [Anaerobacillus sp. HL2]
MKQSTGFKTDGNKFVYEISDEEFQSKVEASGNESTFWNYVVDIYWKNFCLIFIGGELLYLSKTVMDTIAGLGVAQIGIF